MQNTDHVDDLAYISQLVGVRDSSSSSSSEASSSGGESSSEENEDDVGAQLSTEPLSEVAAEVAGSNTIDVVQGCLDAVIGIIDGTSGSALVLGQSDSDESDDSDDEIVPKARVQGSNRVQADSDDEDARVIPRTKNEMEEIPTTPVELVLQSLGPDDMVAPLGHITAVVSNQVIVTSDVGVAIIAEDSLLSVTGRIILGQVSELFGPTHQPLYSVSFPSADLVTPPPELPWGLLLVLPYSPALAS